jgi:hypothetical protein
VGGVVAVVVVGITVAAVAHTMLGHNQASAAPSSNPDALRQAAATRNLAAAWIAGQVSRSVIVSCDPAMCRALQARKIPDADLAAMGASGASPLHSALIVATPAIRAQFGTSLTVDAPAVIASFGSGSERIDIRAIAQHGVTAFRTILNSDVLARKESGTGLLHSGRVVVGAKARAQLDAGEVDSRLLVTIAELATSHPVEVMAFGDPDPGVGAAATASVSPLRLAELAPAPNGPRMSASEFVRSVFAFLQGQPFPFLVSGMQQVNLPGHKAAVRVEFAAPTPLNLISGSGTGPGG